MFKQILVPVDLAEVEVARPAIDKAVALAGITGAKLQLVYVRSILPVTFMEYVPPSFDEEQQGQCEKELRDVAATVQMPPSVSAPPSAWGPSTTRCSPKPRASAPT